MLRLELRHVALRGQVLEEGRVRLELANTREGLVRLGTRSFDALARAVEVVCEGAAPATWVQQRWAGLVRRVQPRPPAVWARTAAGTRAGEQCGEGRCAAGEAHQACRVSHCS
jgi:hypothetical protein